MPAINATSPGSTRENSPQIGPFGGTSPDLARDLPCLDVVYAKELAFAAGISVRQVQDRFAIWRADKTDPRGIPHLPQLGIPWRMSRAQAKAFLSAEVAA